MKQIDDIRRDNMTSLRDEFGGVAGLARKLDRSESQVSQWIKGASHSVTGKPRGMKSATARWIEVIAEKPEGWLDKDNSAINTLPPQDKTFLDALGSGIKERAIPEHIRQTILTLIESSPKKGAP